MLLAGTFVLAVAADARLGPNHEKAISREERPQMRLASLPVRFAPNAGQAPAPFRYIGRGNGLTVLLGPAGMELALAGERLRLGFVGANPSPAIIPEGEPAGTENYLLGNDPAGWVTGVASSASVRYRGVYPGTDLVFHGSGGRLEYDIVLAPGTDPSVVRFEVAKPARISLDHDGGLLLAATTATIRQRPPSVYQEVSGRRRQVSGGYRISGNQMGFWAGSYDRSLPLVIDPVLSYSTFLGGGGSDRGLAIALGADGSAYIAGDTLSNDFPTTAAALEPHRPPGQPSCDPIFGCLHAFVAKLNPQGTGLVYSTYLGGSSGDTASGIAVDQAGRAYVTGATRSADFPVRNALQPAIGGGTCHFGLTGVGPCLDAFLTVLDPAGTSLAYSTYLGGAGDDQGLAIALDTSGIAHITGVTGSPGLPASPTALQPHLRGGTDAFVAAIDPSKAGPTSLVYLTYLGGSGDEDVVAGATGAGIGLDRAGNVYVGGTTCSRDFPAMAAFQPQPAGKCNAFVAKLSANGSQLGYSTYLGGHGDTRGLALAVDQSGAAYLAGLTTSPDLPATTRLSTNRPAGPGPAAGFVSKLEPGGSRLAFSSYLGGSGKGAGDRVQGLAVDPSGRAYLTGQACSEDFPQVEPVARREGSSGYCHAFVARVAPDGSRLEFSTYLSGSGQESGRAIAVDAAGAASVTGETSSVDFPTIHPLQESNAGRGLSDLQDVFVARIEGGATGQALVFGVAPASGAVTGGTRVVITGRGLAAARSVHFGEVAAASFHISSDARIEAISPRHAEGYASISVTTARGASPANPATSFVYGLGQWRSAGRPLSDRSAHTATVLRDGRVLVAGGLGPSGRPLATAEIYDPAHRRWSATGRLTAPRARHTATVLADGRVLVAGGLGYGLIPLDTAEIYDPARGQWSGAASMATARSGHTASLLAGGKVLIAGGSRNESVALASTELFDPGTGGWSAGSPMSVPRQFHTATSLGGGRVLVAGGCCAAKGRALDSAEIYDQAAGTWRPTGSLTAPRARHTATLLRDGRVVAAGGFDETSLQTAEIYDPHSGEWTLTGLLGHARASHVAGALPGGEVLVAGGAVGNGGPIASAEVLDPVSGKWHPAGLMDEPRGSQAFPAASGVLVRGRFCGRGCGGVLITGGPPDVPSELYLPSSLLDHWAQQARLVRTAELIGLALAVVIALLLVVRSRGRRA